jgi:hypothetical protein
MDLGLENVYRESIDTSVRLAADVLRKLGFRAYTLHRAARQFIRHDEAALRKLAAERHDKAAYISRVREEIALQERLLQEDRAFIPSATDHAWDSEPLREAANRGARPPATDETKP